MADMHGSSGDVLLDLLAERERQLLAEQAVGVDDEEALRLEGSFIDFVEAGWPSIDPADFQRSYVVEAMADHLQAVADGQIKRLLINVPPRSSKTLLASVCFPAWLWAQRERSYLKGPQCKILSASYGHSLSIQNSNACRRLILSPFYQALFGHRWKLTEV
jgi:hypothetical protein